MCEWQARQAAEEHKMYKPSWLARILLRRVKVVADYSLSVTGRQSFEGAGPRAERSSWSNLPSRS